MLIDIIMTILICIILYRLYLSVKFKIMKIKNALKRKNRLIQENNQNWARVNQHNLRQSDDAMAQEYDARKCLEEYQKGVEALIELKVKIHKANVPVFEKIFRLAELKGLISSLRSLKTKRLVLSDGILMVPVIGLLERDDLISQYEAEIEKIQDELDYFNATTEIE